MWKEIREGLFVFVLVVVAFYFCGRGCRPLPAPSVDPNRLDTLQTTIERHEESNYNARVRMTDFQKWVYKWTDTTEDTLDRYGTYLEHHCKRIAAVEANVPTIENMAPKVIPGVVHVMCPQWQGSGFVVRPRLIATARHIIEGVTDFTITTHDGHKVRATRAISFKNRDVGFIWVDDLRCVAEVEKELECAKVKHEVKLQELELGSIKDCALGQPVFAIGSPFGKVNFNHLSSGIISAIDRSWDELGEDYGWKIGWTTTVAGHPGNSGCPVFTLDGRVRGVLVGGFSPVLVIAMPADLFLDHLDEITTMFEMDKFRKEQRRIIYPATAAENENY